MTTSLLNADQYIERQINEEKRFKAFFEHEWETLYPKPTLKVVGLDWRFYMTLYPAISLVSVTAWKTSQMFYKTELLSSPAWIKSAVADGQISISALVVATLSMIGFEVFLASISAVKTYDVGKVNKEVYSWLIFILLTVSLMANFGESIGLAFSLSQEAMNRFSIALLIAIGMGAPLGSWLSGEVIGVQLLKAKNATVEAGAVFKNEMDEYLNRARTLWAERISAEQKELAEREERDRKKAERAERAELKVKIAQERPSTGKRAMIWAVLDEWKVRALETGQQDIVFVDLVKLLADKYPGDGYEGTQFQKSQISTERKAWFASLPQSETEEYPDGA